MDALSDGSVGDVHALLVLDALPGVGPARAMAAVERFGGASLAVDAGPRALSRALRRPVSRIDYVGARAQASETIERVAQLGLSLCALGDPDYPARLLHLVDPPLVLFLRGRRELLADGAVTIVGSRRASQLARDVAERLGAAVAAAGRPVGSGMALGVDGAAHIGALRSGGATIAVLGTGADVPYPRRHLKLYRRICDEGLVVSEFPPGTPALPHHFPRRNRVLAALAEQVVVVEAGAKSGSLITVDHALDLGREVWAVPGPIERRANAGSNRLLSDGARALTSIEAFVQVVAPTNEPVLELALPEGNAGRALAAMTLEPVAPEELAASLALPLTEVVALLGRLEVEGRVDRLPGHRFRIAA